MELSFGEMLVIVLAIIVLFGPDKLPEIARGLGQGVRKMRGAMEDIKFEIMKETDNPVSEIKKEIEKVKQAAKDYDPTQKIKDELDFKNLTASNKNEAISEDKAPENTPEIDQLSDEHNGPVSR